MCTRIDQCQPGAIGDIVLRTPVAADHQTRSFQVAGRVVRIAQFDQQDAKTRDGKPDARIGAAAIRKGIHP
ncbi:hypothetical protein D3C87_1994840 [compost metagenome]